MVVSGEVEELFRFQGVERGCVQIRTIALHTTKSKDLFDDA